MPIDRPSIVEENHLQFLDDLRSVGSTNMFGAVRPLIAHFGVTRDEATIILRYWMESFSERHPE